MYTTIL